MQISNPTVNSSSLLRENILEKANQAFSGGEKAEDFSKKINDAINSVADSQNKASKITKDYELGKETDLITVISLFSNISHRLLAIFKLLFITITWLI
mgnify:CR=1 FL=1